MSVYEGEYAELYDLFYGDKPYDDEAAFINRLLRDQARGPSVRLLDLACGTGQHAVRLAALGWEVLGIDQSADMLRRAEQRANDSVNFMRQDMRELHLPFAAFDAAVCLFDSIGYGRSNDAIVGTLLGVRRHLRPNGLFAVEFWHAPPMLREHEPIRVRRWSTSDGSVVRISQTTLDVVNQLARVEYTVYRFRPDGTYRLWNEVHENRYFLVQEMSLLLRQGGFEPLQYMAAFDEAAPVDGSTWHVIALARAADGEAR